MRPGGDAVVDGRSQELLEAVGGKEIEVGLLGIANQQASLLQGAGDTRCDGVQQGARATSTPIVQVLVADVSNL